MSGERLRFYAPAGTAEYGQLSRRRRMLVIDAEQHFARPLNRTARWLAKEIRREKRRRG